jgi:serine/threonine protein kinase
MKFLRDLQNLLEFGYHSNILNFFGICKTHDWFFVVFEFPPENLKQFLLSHRYDDNQNTDSVQGMTSLGEDQALKLVLELLTGMEYLKHNKIIHKNCNSHNIRVKRQSSSYTTLLITVFGPTLYSIAEDGSKAMVDDDRWFAPEVLRFQKFSHSSDVYSVALVIWEICCLGGTFFQNIPTNDLFVRIKKGIRPEKYEFISEDLYQLLLNSWELDPTERFEFNDLVGQIKHFLLSPQYYLNYSLNGHLPFHLPLLEIKT